MNRLNGPWIGGCLFFLLLAGCGGGPSTQQQWQATLQDANLKPAEKLEKIAQQMFDADAVTVSTVAGQHNVSLTILGADPSLVVKSLQATETGKRNAALKQYYLRPVIAQLGNYIHYTRVHHLGTLNVDLSVPEINGQEVTATRTVPYSFQIQPKDFDAIEAAAKLAPRDAIEKCESTWSIQANAWDGK